MDFERSIIESVLSGEGAQFEVLVKKYLPKLMGFFYKMGLSWHDAEDLAQDTLCKAYENLYRYHAHWAFSTWLYKIASNTYKDFLRKHRPASELHENLSTDDRAESQLDRALLQQDIKRLLQILKTDVRAMFLLHYYNGLPMEEIGRLYNLSPTAVKMKLFRAREKLIKNSVPDKEVMDR